MIGPNFPLSALVGLDTLKTALLIAAVDGRLGVLLRGEKGSGKSTAARAVASLLPSGAPFVNLPVGATEDRLLGGLDLARAMKGEPALKSGLLSQAHGGLLYIDEVNLLPDHLADALLDAAASGVNVVEREGFSESHEARFVLVGSMNPEEGGLRPQLLDRFALAADVAAPADPAHRRLAVERRIAYDANPAGFIEAWRDAEADLRARVHAARGRIGALECPPSILEMASASVCEQGVTSLRADLAAVRASVALAALQDSQRVTAEHLAAVLPLVLAHRARRPRPQAPPPPPPPLPPSPEERSDQSESDRVFAVKDVQMPKLSMARPAAGAERGSRPLTGAGGFGPAVRARPTDEPGELDARATVLHAVVHHGSPIPAARDLHEVVRAPATRTRYLFVVDSSGSHAVRRRMELVKGAILGLLETSAGARDEVCLVGVRGPSASMLLAPTRSQEEARRVLAHLPTGGRTPLAHGLELAAQHATPGTVVVLVTDGRANVPSRTSDARSDALEAAAAIGLPSLVVDSETGPERLGLAGLLADAMGATLVRLEDLEAGQLIRLSRARADSHA